VMAERHARGTWDSVMEAGAADRRSPAASSGSGRRGRAGGLGDFVKGHPRGHEYEHHDDSFNDRTPMAREAHPTADDPQPTAAAAAAVAAPTAFETTKRLWSRELETWAAEAEEALLSTPPTSAEDADIGVGAASDDGKDVP